MKKRIAITALFLISIQTALAQINFRSVDNILESVFRALQQPYIKAFTILLLIFMIVYATLAQALRRIPGFEENGKLNKNGKIIAVGMAFLTDFWLFFQTGRDITRVSEIVLRTFGIYGAVVLVALFAIILYYWLKDVEFFSNSKVWLALACIAIGLLVIGTAFAVGWMVDWGTIIMLIAGIALIAGFFALGGPGAIGRGIGNAIDKYRDRRTGREEIPIPGPPTGFRADPVEGQKQAKIVWRQNPEAQSTQLQKRTPGKVGRLSSPYKTLPQVFTDERVEFIDDDVEYGQMYYYRARSKTPKKSAWTHPWLVRMPAEGATTTTPGEEVKEEVKEEPPKNPEVRIISPLNNQHVQSGGNLLVHFETGNLANPISNVMIDGRLWLENIPGASYNQTHKLPELAEGRHVLEVESGEEHEPELKDKRAVTIIVEKIKTPAEIEEETEQIAEEEEKEAVEETNYDRYILDNVVALRNEFDKAAKGGKFELQKEGEAAYGKIDKILATIKGKDKQFKEHIKEINKKLKKDEKALKKIRTPEDEERKAAVKARVEELSDITDDFESLQEKYMSKAIKGLEDVKRAIDKNDGEKGMKAFEAIEKELGEYAVQLANIEGKLNKFRSVVQGEIEVIKRKVRSSTKLK